MAYLLLALGVAYGLGWVVNFCSRAREAYRIVGRRDDPPSTVSWAMVAALRDDASNLTEAQRNAGWRAVVGQKVQWTGELVSTGRHDAIVKLRPRPRISRSSSVDVWLHLQPSYDSSRCNLQEGETVSLTGLVAGGLHDSNVTLQDATMERCSQT